METLVRERRTYPHVRTQHADVPNELTAAAIEDARNHRGLKAVDMSSFESFVSSMGI